MLRTCIRLLPDVDGFTILYSAQEVAETLRNVELNMDHMYRTKGCWGGYGGSTEYKMSHLHV